jgi:hypothetical protein
MGSAYTQNFDSLANTASGTPPSVTWTDNSTIAGWYSNRATCIVSTGSLNNGGLYSYGSASASDRALGSVGSGSASPVLYAVRFVNGTGATINGLSISYTGEQWRNSGNTTQHSLTFAYQVGATAIGTGTWTTEPTLGFTGPVATATAGALDGNLAQNRVARSGAVNVPVAPGQEIWLRWEDIDNAGSDHGLSIDNLSVTPQAAPVDVAPSVSSTTPPNGATNVAPGTTITINFSESVDVASAADFSLECPVSTPIGYTVTTPATLPAAASTFVITPAGGLPVSTTCTVTVFASAIGDTDLNDPPNNMVADYVGTFTTSNGLPDLTVNNVTLAEGSSGTTNFVFTVSLSAPAGPGGVTFDIATADGTAQDDNPTTEDNDYVAQTLTGQTIPAASSTFAFTVAVNGDTTPEANETFFVNVTNITGANAGDTQGQGTINNDDVALTPIHDIQGPVASSPIVGSSVTTRGIVTGVKSNGFFIQEPDASMDADPLTSEGILVYTSSAPPAAAVVGNLVQVTGTVSEFAPGRGSLTELTSPVTILVSSGNPLPAPMPLTAAFPSPSGAWDQTERYEGMRVSVASFTVTAPTTGGVNEPNATGSTYGEFFGTVTGVVRPLREEGIQQPDAPPAGSTIPPLPRWDSNPELLRVDSDGLVGGTTLNLATGAVLTGLVGPLDYAYDRYSILPDPSAPPTVTPGMVATAVSTPLGTEFTVASYNLERFFDSTAGGDAVLTPTAFANRLRKASLQIRNFLRTPDVIGIVEVENLTTLQALATQVSNDAIAAGQPDPLYQAYVVEGNDVGGIDVGFLVKTAPVAPGGPARVGVAAVTQERAGTLFTYPDNFTELLNDRPPLMLRGVVNHANGGQFPVTVIVNHLRSLNDVDSTAAGSHGFTTLGQRVRAKRLAQALDLADLVQDRQAADATERIILVGDFNAFEVNDGYGHSMATIAGVTFADNTTAVPADGTNTVEPDLVNLTTTSPAAERYSFVFEGTDQSLDHLLVNAPTVSSTLARRLEHPRVNADFPETDRSLYGATDATRLSDHDPLVGFFQVAAFASAGLAVRVTDAPDPVFPGAGLSYTINVTNGGPDAATNVTLTDVLPAGTVFASLTAPGGWTCSTPALGAAGTVTCSIATLPNGGAGSFLLNVMVGALAGGTVLSNTLTVSATSGDPSSADNTATATTTVQTPPAVFATKAAAGLNAPGAPVTYTIVLQNNGTTAQADNPGDELVDVLPASLTLVSATATSGTAVATVATNTVTWNGPVPAGGSVTVTIAAAISASATVGQVISNQGTIAYDRDGNGSNESAALTDDPTTGAVGDPTSITVTRDANGAAIVPALDGAGLGLLAALVALGGALVLGRRLA